MRKLTWYLKKRNILKIYIAVNLLKLSLIIPVEGMHRLHIFHNNDKIADLCTLIYFILFYRPEVFLSTVRGACVFCMQNCWKYWWYFIAFFYRSIFLNSNLERNPLCLPPGFLSAALPVDLIIFPFTFCPNSKLPILWIAKQPQRRWGVERGEMRRLKGIFANTITFLNGNAGL